MASDKLKFIDALRGIAVLLVIVVHHGQGFRGLPTIQWITGFGQMGVQLFFIASAYTLCRSMASKPDDPVGNFYIRRFFRIAPLYYCGIVLYAAVAYVQASGGGVDRTSDYSTVNVLVNFLFLHGFVPSANNSVVHGGWSIATEMLFYVIFPLLFIVVRAWPLAAIIAAILLNVAIQMFLIYGLHRSGIGNNTFLYYSLLNQLPVFLLGIWLFVRDSGSGGAISDALLMTLFGVACFSCLNWNWHIAAVLSPVLAGCCFVFLFRLARRFCNKGGILAKVGEVSYSMYIFHFVFAWWLTGLAIDLGISYGVPLPGLYIATLAMTLVLTYWIAKLTKLTIEDRFIALGGRVIRSISSGASAPAVVAGK